MCVKQRVALMPPNTEPNVNLNKHMQDVQLLWNNWTIHLDSSPKYKQPLLQTNIPQKKHAKQNASNTIRGTNRSGLKWICIFLGWLVIDLCVCLIGDGFICLSDPALICSSGRSGFNWLTWWDPTGFEHKQTLINIFTCISHHCPVYFRRMWKECVCPE